MTIYRAYRTELQPNNHQRTDLMRHVGTARFVYNWGLAQKQQAYKSGQKTPSAFDLSRILNSIKANEFPWMYEVSKCAAQESLKNLDRAYQNFFRNCRTQKKQKGFPQFKSKAVGLGSCRLTGAIHVSPTHIQLPRLGLIRLRQHGYLPTADVKILSATVSERAGRWFVSLQVQRDIPDPFPKPESIVGVDLGIKTLAVCSDGTEYANPKALRSHLKRLKHYQRLMSHKQNKSRNRQKAKQKVARLHLHISNIRKDCLHKLTTRLTKTNSTVVIEDLHVAGMLRNHRLAQAISDVGFGEFRRQLTYKGLWYGCEIVVAPRFYPSSKLCSDCGLINEDLTLKERVWTCECGAVHDRDRNAAINLKSLAGRSPERLNARRETRPLVESSDPSKSVSMTQE